MTPTRGILIAAGILALFLLPWIFGGTFLLSHEVYGRFDEWRYSKTSHFDSERWQKPDLKYRYSVLEEVLQNQIKKGMSKSELTAFLGKPDSIDPNGCWQYETKRPGWTLIDWNGGGISVKFSSNHKVLEAEDNRWVD